MNIGLLAAAPALGELLTGPRLVVSLLGIMGVAVAASRLLGARRSLGAVLVSGFVGWLAGAALAVTLARSHEHGDAGFTRNLWLFAAFFTMSATVWIEMLAKPGSLARTQTLLASVPRPIRAVRRRSRRLGRYIEISRIAARNGLGRSLGIEEADEAAEAKAPLEVRLRRALEQAGGMFVKLGQVMSTRSDLLPPEVTAELAKLQDHVPPAPRTEVEPMLDHELGGSVDAVFASFDWEPLAAASIGQVYRARLTTGEAVVVKVQRPGIRESVDRDLDVLGQLSQAFEARVGWAADYDVEGLVTEFSDRLREELDFRVEARNALDIAAATEPDSGITVPRVHQELSDASVLVVEWLDGVSARQVEDIDAMGFDRRQLAETILRYFLQQMLMDGRYHADPHPGNVFILTDGRVGLIDFGAVGRLDAIQQTALRTMLLAVGQQDPSLLRQAVLEVATVRGGFDDEQFERALARFMARHLGPGAVPSAAMFNDLLKVLFAFSISLPAEFSTFFRALVTLEGTLTTLSPGFGVVQAAQDIGGEWARARLAPESLADFARDEALHLAPLLRRLPRQLDRLATMATRGDLRTKVSLLSFDSDVRVVTKLVNRTILAFFGGIVGILSVMLIGIKGGPEFTGDTTLYQFFGYFGLFCASILIMRVLIAIFHERLN